MRANRAGDRSWSSIVTSGLDPRAVGAEFAFASEVLGTGGEWTTIQGGSDEHWIKVLRRLQHRVPKARRFLGP
jgi:hypothetical protein